MVGLGLGDSFSAKTVAMDWIVDIISDIDNYLYVGQPLLQRPSYFTAKN